MKRMKKKLRTKLCATGVALMSSVCVSPADDAVQDPIVTLKVNGNEVGIEQIENIVGGVIKSLPESSPEEILKMIEMMAKTGGDAMSSADVSIKINDEAVDVAQIETLVGFVLRNLPSQSLEDTALMIDQIAGSMNMEEILKSLTVDSKAFVVGPDGQTQEVEIKLNGGMMAQLPMMMGFSTGDVSLGDLSEALPHYIGVAVEEVPDLLRAHVAELKEQGGLLVKSVFDRSPAKAVGVQESDIILKISGEEVNGRDSLVKAVQKAGEENVTLEMEIIRNGKKMMLSIEPAKREMPSVVSKAFVPNTGTLAVDGELETLRKEVRENRVILDNILKELQELKGAEGEIEEAE